MITEIKMCQLKKNIRKSVIETSKNKKRTIFYRMAFIELLPYSPKFHRPASEINPSLIEEAD